MVIMLAGFQGKSCEPETAAWKRMEVKPLLLVGPKGQVLRFEVKVADEEQERRAGFQHICSRTVDRAPMLFVFKRSLNVAFHMNKVHVPLEIGFFDAQGMLIDIQRMEPYGPDPKTRKLYGPAGPVLAALETKTGFFGQHGISSGKWRLRYPAE